MPTIRSTRESGVTLIELMVAMVLGLLVAAGIITVFMSTSSSNKAQNQLARLQEEGRFAVTRLGDDLRMANGQYCTNTGGTAKPTSSGTYVDGMRAPKVYATNLTGALYDVTTQMGSGVYPAVPAAPYTFPSFLYMRGYECSKNSCTPVNPETGTSIPSMGTAVGDRVVGADVLTLRYLDSSAGWAVVGSPGTRVNATGSALTSVTLVPASSESAASAFTSGDLAMLADCSNAQIFAADRSGTDIAVNGANLGTPSPQEPLSAPRLFDLNKDYKTVTYFLQVKDTGNGQTTGVLVRRLNGVNTELVRGVERLDFRYGVQDVNGNTRYLTADQVDAVSGANCPPGPPSPLSAADPGCMWRAVSSIEVNILMDGQTPLYTLTPNELKYSYASDATTATRVAPDGHAITPTDQGFVDPMLRREFISLISVRNYNP